MSKKTEGLGVPVPPPPSAIGVKIMIDIRDSGEYNFVGIRTTETGEEQLLPPEIMALMARVIDWQMVAAASEMKKAQGPKIQMARGAPFRG